MSKNTKELIWQQSLILFSTKGYEGVTVKEIANAVNIKDSSLYKHYKSKREIFETILIEVTKRIDSAREEFSYSNDEYMVEKYKNVSLDTLSKMCFSLFEFYISDDIVSKFRRMLTIEQYSNSDVCKLYKKVFIDDVLEMETALFKSLIKQGLFIEDDPYIMALNFYSPLFLLLCKCDSESINKKQVQELIKRLVNSFAKCYCR